MKKIVLTFGVLSGIVIAILMSINTVFAEQIGFDRAVVTGYTVIVISMLFVYFGVRSYRDDVLGGRISFGQAFTAGLLITVIACSFYVASWLVLYYNFMPDFADRYAAYLVDSVRAKGASAAEIEEAVRQGNDAKAMLQNPFINAAVTFTEPFPVGLLITLLSAAVLKKKAT